LADQPHRFAGRISDWILHKDNQVIAFNKPAGLPVQPDKSKDPSLLGLGASYIRHDLYPIHRLDRPTSGLVLLGQKPSAQAAVSEQFKAGTVDKQYLAIVGERPADEAGTRVQWISEERNNRSVVSDDESPGARRAELTYRYLGSSERYHLLHITLKTGRKHQIRAQMAALGSPLRGDTKYGFKRSNPGGTIDLHSWKLAFDHPISKQRIQLTAPPPDEPVWAAFAEVIEALDWMN
jgi:23S rRNA pseudouridine1911/1915/1917 synthase